MACHLVEQLRKWGSIGAYIFVGNRGKTQFGGMRHFQKRETSVSRFRIIKNDAKVQKLMNEISPKGLRKRIRENEKVELICVEKLFLRWFHR